VTTYTAFVNGLEALVVTGVTTRLSQSAPLGLNSADLPVQWVAAPSGSDAAITAKAEGGWKTLRANLIIAYEAAGQDTGPANFVGTVTMLDNLESALCGATTLCQGPLHWEIKIATVSVAGVNYWAAIASVEGSG
jgi:hypothetical protein